MLKLTEVQEEEEEKVEKIIENEKKKVENILASEEEKQLRVDSSINEWVRLQKWNQKVKEKRRKNA